jgi:hypothetical protein
MRLPYKLDQNRDIKRLYFRAEEFDVKMNLLYGKLPGTTKTK